MTTTLANLQNTTRATPGLSRVSVVMWQPYDGMAQAIAEALLQLGYDVVPFAWNQPVPDGVDAVFSHGPYGRFLSIPSQLGQLLPDKRPLLVHWNALPPPALANHVGPGARPVVDWPADARASTHGSVTAARTEMV